MPARRFGVPQVGEASMKPGIPAFALLVAGTAFAISMAAAQTVPPAPPVQPPFAVPPFKNLKVLPKDISRADLIANMKFFTRSLGVRCTYCHVGEESQPLSAYDFVSDAKDHKNTARAMLAMVAMLNEKTLPAATGLPDAKVTCFTCHRGVTKPATEPPPVAPPVAVLPPPKP
jgi:hypothetical protein